MSRAEMKKALVLEKLVYHHITTKEAATALGLSVRQVHRLKKRFLDRGPVGLIHQNRGRQPAHAIPEEKKQHIVQLYQQKYYGSNNCHYAELLEEHENMKISVPTVRRILLEEGLKQPRQQRKPKAHRPRKRKPQAGLLWQIDATPFDWTEGRSAPFTLLGAIDDATGQVVGAVFRLHETMEGYFEVMGQGIRRYGLPAALYSDQHTIFRSPNEKLTVEQELAGEQVPLTNFGKAMADLNIAHPKAHSPQAKGRVERLWQTFQDRLVIEFRIRNISTLEEANAVLPQLIAKHNRRFAVKPEQSESAYRALDPDFKLDHIFCLREHRIMGPGQTLSYKGKIYTITQQRQMVSPKTQVEVRETMKGKVFLWYQGKAYELVETQKPAPVEQKKTASPRSSKPAADHLWRTWRGPKELKKSSSQT